MAATAQFIEFDNHDAINIANAGGFSTKLVTNFRVFHGDQLTCRPDLHNELLVTQALRPPSFILLGNFEVWQAIAVVPATTSRSSTSSLRRPQGQPNVKKIFHTNFGNTFQIKATHF